MDAQSFFDEAAEHLEVDWLVITPREGRRIDVGEEFDVQLSIRNTFDGVGFPAFKDIELDIQGTSYAQPEGDPNPQIDGRLGPGEILKLVVRFRALASDALGDGSTEMEPIAQVRARARLDLESVPDIQTEPRVLRAQIHGGPGSR